MTQSGILSAIKKNVLQLIPNMIRLISNLFFYPVLNLFNKAYGQNRIHLTLNEIILLFICECSIKISSLLYELLALLLANLKVLRSMVHYLPDFHTRKKRFC